MDAPPSVEVSPRVGRLLNRGVFALLDQGLFAAANFVLNVLLAKWLPADAYGAFTVAFSVLMLLATVHNGLLTEPMLVFGAHRFEGRLRRYLSGLVLGHWLVSAGVTVVMLLVTVGVWLGGSSTEVTMAMLGFAIVAPLILLLLLMRRTCYVKDDPRQAAMAGLCYFVLMMGGVLLMHWLGRLSIGWSLASMALAGAVSGGWLLWAQRITMAVVRDRGLLNEMATAHWRFGRWASLSGILGFFPGYIYYLMLPMFAGVEQTGILRALSNFILPFMQAVNAMWPLLAPRMAKARASGAFPRASRSALLVLGLGPLVIWLLLGLLHEPLVRFVYDGRYVEHSSLLWWIGLQPALTGVAGVLILMINAHDQPDRVFIASVVTATASLVIGFLVVPHGVRAAAIGTVANLVINAAMLAYFGLKYARTTRPAS